MRFARTLVALGVTAFSGGCVLLSGVGDLTIDDEVSPDATLLPIDGSTGATDAPTSDSPATPGSDGGPDAAIDGATCRCDGLVSAYRFGDPQKLGADAFGKNDMLTVNGTPKQSISLPNGVDGHAIELDGASSVCINSNFTFDASKEHTLCWWARPDALGDRTNQFAQLCIYDTWTNTTGTDYIWRINNCNAAIGSEIAVSNVYSVGTWVQICQTYRPAKKERRVIINGKTSEAASTNDADGIPLTMDPWCIGSYGGNGPSGFWKGLIFLPMWFSRVLDDSEIQRIEEKTCCLP